MTLDMKLLNVLACPDCQTDVMYRKVGKKEELVCTKCERVFAIEDGVPLMLPRD